MKSSVRMALRLGAVALSFSAAGIIAVAKDGRDFAGFYEVSDVMDFGDDVGLGFSVRVFNFGDVDVNDAVVVLGDLLQPDDVYGLFGGVFIPRRESVLLKDGVVVPRWEYELWLAGASPHLTVKWVDGQGNVHLRAVELVAMTLGEND